MRKTLLLTLLLLCSPWVAFAQDTPAFDVSAGYAFLRDQDAKENLHGWIASVTGNLNRWLGITGEIGGHYKTLDILGIDLDVSLHSFMVGPRVASRSNPSATAFGQLLVGSVHGSASFSGETNSATEFAIQPGGGVDFWLRPNVGVRVGGDYRRIMADETDADEFRFYVGVVFSSGTR